MIIPSEKLKKFIEIYTEQADACKILGIDQVTLSYLLNGKRGASARVIEKVCRGTRFSMDEAWGFAEGDGEE